MDYILNILTAKANQIKYIKFHRNLLSIYLLNQIVLCDTSQLNNTECNFILKKIRNIDHLKPSQ